MPTIAALERRVNPVMIIWVGHGVIAGKYKAKTPTKNKAHLRCGKAS